MKRTKIAYLIAFYLIASSAYAQSNKNSTNFFSIGVEGSYNLANNFIDNSKVTVIDEKKKVAGYRLFLGYNLNENIAFELGYLGTGKFKVTAIDSGTPYDVSIKINGVELSALYKFTQSAPGLFLKAGIIHSKVDPAQFESKKGIGYLFGLGYEMNLIDNLDGRIAYTRYERLGGESRFKMNTFSAGLKYNF